MMLFNTVLDIKYKIASFSSIAWYKLYLYDEEFREYARTNSAINEFVRLFALVEHIRSPMLYARVQTSMFGLIHSFNDEPAVVFNTGKKMWYHGGCIYRGNDEPAIIYENGTKIWYNKYNIIDRDNDEPAIIRHTGTKEWHKNGLLHRDNDLPAYTRDDMHAWYQNGLRHRNNDKPAMVIGNTMMWFENGKRHRGNNRPAIIWNDGREEWWRDGIYYIP